PAPCVVRPDHTEREQCRRLGMSATRTRAAPPSPPRRHLPIELHEVFLDPPSIRSIRLERQVLSESVLGLLVIFLLVVQKPELPERIREHRIELGGALVPLEGL